VAVKLTVRRVTVAEQIRVLEKVRLGVQLTVLKRVTVAVQQRVLQTYSGWTAESTVELQWQNSCQYCRVTIAEELTVL